MKTSSLALAVVMTCFASTALATNYAFLPVNSTGVASSQFVSQYGNGVINVTHTFSPGGAGAADNQNNLIFPSQFTTLFPGTGQVQGHLAQTVYNESSVVTFDLTGYNLKPSTVFGMWNTSDEVPQPAYRVELIDANNNAVPPTTFNLIGNQDNQTQVAGRHQMVLNTASGDITTGTLLNPSGTHTDAAFWDNIPAGTKQIIVYGNLPPLNNIGDGVGYYFVEQVPEPSTFALGGLGLLALGAYILRRKR